MQAVVYLGGEGDPNREVDCQMYSNGSNNNSWEF